MQNKYNVANKCRSCNSTNLKKILPLEDMPAGDLYKIEKQELSTVIAPASIFRCGSCGHMQMEAAIDAGDLYANYLSRPAATNSSLSEIYKVYAEKIQELSNAGRVLEIGSNDGLFLQHLKSIGVNSIGIEPAKNLHDHALEVRKVNSINGFFDKDTLITHGLKNFKVIFANHSVSNIENIRDLAGLISESLEKDGVFIMQTFYQIEVLRQKLIENYNHEHLSYFTVSTLRRHFEQFGLRLYDAEYVEAKGGSIRCYFKNQDSLEDLSMTSRCSELLKKEDSIESNIETLFSETIEYISERKNKLPEIIDRLAKGKKTAAYGTSIGATVFLYQFKIGNLIDIFFDDDELRQNRFSPGFAIPVREGRLLNASEYGACIITAPLYGDAIRSKHSDYVKKGGKFVGFWPTIKEF